MKESTRAKSRSEPSQSTALRDGVLQQIRALVAKSPPGSRLPTVRRMISDFGASQHVVHAALEQLRSEGLVASFVGRGTFSTDPAGSPAPKKCLTLLYHHPYERGDRIAQLIHRELSLQGHDSLVLTYSNTEQVMDMLRTGVRFDSCILQPRSSIVPISLLALLKERSKHLLIESLSAEHLDVDAVSNDPAVCVRLTVSHLAERGYREIIWLTEDGENYFFRRVAEIFEGYCRGGALDQRSRIIRAPIAPERLGVADLAGALRSLGLSQGEESPPAVVVASFADGQTIVRALTECGLVTPRDVAVLHLGTPDLEGDHVGLLTTVGRTSSQAAQTVLDCLDWRWRNPSAPWKTHYDSPTLIAFESTGRALRR